MSEMIKLTGLWENKDKNGNTYFNASWPFGKILIYKNDFKKKETDPDWNIWLAKKEKNGAQENNKKANNEIDW